jgi:hypothetical protein
MDKQITKHIIIHKSTNVTIQDTDMLAISKNISNINTRDKLSLINHKLTKLNKINFSRNNIEGFKDMNMVLNKTKHIIQQRVGYKDKDKSITIYIRMDKLIMY